MKRALTAIALIIGLGGTGALLSGCGTQDWDDTERRAFPLMAQGTYDCTGGPPNFIAPVPGDMRIFRSSYYYQNVNFATAPCINLGPNTNYNNWSGYTWGDGYPFNGLDPVAWQATRQSGTTQVVYLTNSDSSNYYLHYDSTSTQTLNVPGSTGFDVAFVSNSRY